MPNTLAACPFCNAELPPLPAPPVGPRTPCPRCGEAVPSERFPLQTAIVAGPPPPLAALPSNVPGNKKTARIVLSVMAGMAVLTLIFALYTQQIRRQRDYRDRTDAAELARKPAELLGLAYLPEGTTIVLGVHLAALSDDPTGQALLREPRPAQIEPMLRVVERIGLKPADIDHIVAGTAVRELPPEQTTVIVTRKPYSRSEIETAVKKESVSTSTHQSKPLFKYKESPNPKLWLAEPRVLVWTTLKTEDLDRIKPTPKDPPASLAPTTRAALVDRLGKQSRLWVVGALESARKPIEFGLGLGLLPKAQAPLLRLTKSFAIGVSLHDEGEASLLGSFHTGDAEATPKLAKFLESIDVSGAKSVKVVSPPADVQDPAEQWVTWQMRADANTLRDVLGKLPIGLMK